MQYTLKSFIQSLVCCRFSVSGGSDTAGLGGRGGPYRLDKGHPVHQISDEDKAMVSQESKDRARAIAQEVTLSLNTPNEYTPVTTYPIISQ